MAGFRPTPGRHRHRRRAGQGLHDDATARSASSPTSRSPRPSSRSSSTASSARRCARPSGRSPGRPGCRTSTSGWSTPRSRGAAIDGYAVTNPVGFQGRHVQIGIFNAFAPLVHLGALQSVAVAARPRAARDRRRAVCRGPRASGSDQIRQAGALFVDVGGGTTDVALVRQGGIEGTRMFALGGRAFTKSPRRSAGPAVPAGRGAQGRLRARHRRRPRDEVARRSSPRTSRVWAAGVELVMEELSGGDLLPGRIYLCGGGSRLPEIRGGARRRGVLRSSCRSPGRPRSPSWRPTRSRRSRRDRSARRPAGRDPARARLPGDRAARRPRTRSTSRCGASCAR